MDDWVIVTSGPIWRVHLMAGRLEQEGIRTYVPDETIKVMDPFATGASPLDTDLRVPSSDAVRARAVLAEADAIASASGEAHAEDDEASAEREGIETLARRTRWAAIAFITLPFAAYWGYQYVVRSRRTGIRDARHGLTLGALGVGFLVGVLGLLTWGVLFSVR